MSYASMSIDRRADYYARCAALIAADPLDFYTRAERGRRFQASRLSFPVTPAQEAMLASTATAAAIAWLNSPQASSIHQGKVEQAQRDGALAA